MQFYCTAPAKHPHAHHCLQRLLQGPGIEGGAWPKAVAAGSSQERIDLIKCAQLGAARGVVA